MSNEQGDIRSSLQRKIRAYCDYYRKYRPITDFPAGIEEVSNEGKVGQLRAISKELDMRIREIFSSEEQDRILELMIDQGVQKRDLPKTMSMKKVGQLVRRGAITSEEEYLLAKHILESTQANILDAAEFKALGMLLDGYSVKRPIDAQA